MSVTRITGALLDVLDTLLHAAEEGSELHGWAITKSTRRCGPTVYTVLDRLEDAGWVTGRWEAHNPAPGKPPRRLYGLTPTGYTTARELLAERRPEALHRPPVSRHAPAPGPLFNFFNRLGRRLPGAAR